MGTFLLFPNLSSAQLSTSGRYWPYDINSLHANYGTADDLKSLSTALHSRDMYLMVDVVVNHFASFGENIPWDTFSPLNSEQYFHQKCYITNWADQNMAEQVRTLSHRRGMPEG